MGKFIDLTGQTFEKWTVLKKSDFRKNNKVYWTCKCECGTIRDVVGSDLRSNKSKSCGCLIKEKDSVNFINEVGNKYGRLTVIERVENDNKNEARWKCQCECGNIIITSGYLLRKGATKSCGCLHNDLLSERVINDLTNQQFGLLTALYQNDRNTKKEVIWHCKCQCGTEKDIAASMLVQGRTISCGCVRKSAGELKIKSLLEINKIDFFQEYHPKNSDLFTNARYDFYIPTLKTLIEYDGIQHFQPIDFFGGEVEFKTRKKHDNEKNDWALNNNFTLIRIPYTHYKDLCIEDLMPNTSSFIIHK